MSREVRRRFDSLELEFQAAVSPLIGVLRTEPGSSERAVSTFNPCPSLQPHPGRFLFNATLWSLPQLLSSQAHDRTR